MSKGTLFGHLAAKFYQHPENLATESLHYILQRSGHAKKALLELFNTTGITITEEVKYESQVIGEDHSIPDLVGLDENGEHIVIIESKFWAGLTKNQPTAYVDRLAKGNNAILVFIAPYLRFDTLWPELLRRCQNNSFNLPETKEIGKEFIYINLQSGQVLSLISWRLILSSLIRELESASQNQLVNDALQLKGLCDQMDSEAFLPLQSEELSSNIGTRIYEFCELVDIVIKKLKTMKICNTKGLRAGGGFGYYLRYFKLQNFGCSLQFNASLWSELRETPLWLTVKSKDWEYSTTAKKLLSKLEFEIPPRLIDYENDALYIPIYLPTGVEQEGVVESVIEQLKEIDNLLKEPIKTT